MARPRPAAPAPRPCSVGTRKPYTALCPPPALPEDQIRRRQAVSPAPVTIWHSLHPADSPATPWRAPAQRPPIQNRHFCALRPRPPIARRCALNRRYGLSCSRGGRHAPLCKPAAVARRVAAGCASARSGRLHQLTASRSDRIRVLRQPGVGRPSASRVWLGRARRTSGVRRPLGSPDSSARTDSRPNPGRPCQPAGPGLLNPQ